MKIELLNNQSIKSNYYKIYDEYIVTVNGTVVSIYLSSNLVDIYRSFVCIDQIDLVISSNDRQMILCAMFNRNVIQVFNIHDSQWKCRINEGVAGFISCYWSLDSKAIITQSEFGIQLSIWSLSDSMNAIISNPKYISSNAKRGNTLTTKLQSMNERNQLFACIQRFDLCDYLTIYRMSDWPWVELSRCKCRTSDIVEIQWVNSGDYIIAIDSPLTYKLTVYTPSGEVISKLDAYENALGIRTLVQHPNNKSQLIAVGSHDSTIRLLSCQSFTLCYTLTLSHPKDMQTSLVDDVTEYFLIQENGSGNFLTNNDNPIKSYISFKRCYNKKLDNNSKTKGSGVHWIEFSSTGRYIAGRDESYPNFLWLWNLVNVKLHSVIVFTDSVTHSIWSILSDTLYCSFGSNQVIVYDPLNDSMTWIESNHSVQSVDFINKDIVISGKDIITIGQINGV